MKAHFLILVCPLHTAERPAFLNPKMNPDYFMYSLSDKEYLYTFATFQVDTQEQNMKI